MNKKFNSLTVIICAIFFTSCYADIDLEKYRPDPKAVLNCVVSPDTIVMASISRTWFFTENNPNVSLRDSDVKLYINETFMEQMQWVDITEKGSLNAKGIYVSTITPNPGDIVKVTASTEYGDIWAEDKVPNKVDILDIQMSYRYFDNGSGIIGNGEIIPIRQIELKYEITFQDNIDETNYYLIRIANTDPSESVMPLDYSGDPIFIGQESIFGGSFEGKFLEGQGGRTFSDETINGKKYTLVVKETYINEYYFNEARSRKITLFALSKSYYQYLSSLQYLSDDQIMKNMADYGLSEPKKIYTNVYGGTGILGASQHVDKVVNISEIIQ